jgi:hypothetical protein
LQVSEKNMKLRIFCSIALLWLAAPGLYAQVSAPNAPKPGIARYSDRTVHSIYGLESNLLVNDQLLSEADAISFSDTGGLVSIAGQIQLLNASGAVIGEYDSAEHSPVLNIDGDFTTAVAWLPSRSSVAYWNGQSFVTAEVASGSLPGKVTSIQMANAATAKMLASDAAGNVFAVVVSLGNGQITSVNFLPGIKGPAFQQHSFIVSHDANGLHIEAPNGTVRTLPFAAAEVTFERMSSDWVHLSSTATAQDWALHLNATALHLSQLPAPRESRHLVARPVSPKEMAR